MVRAPCIILVSPQMGENIGAAARVMQNFGLTDLRLVNPRDGWPNVKARDMARNAESVIDAVRVFGTLPEAIADCQRVYATSPRDHNLTKPVLDSRRVAGQMRSEAEQGMKTAILFGPEKHGFNNDEVACADVIVEIPTDGVHSSLNLAQAVAVCAYEWWMSEAQPILEIPTDVASREEWQGAFGQLEQELEACGFFREPNLAATMRRNLRGMLMRSNWNSQEVRTFRGMIKSLRFTPAKN